MKVFLLTNLEGLHAYKNGYSVFEACGEYADRRSEFFYRIEVDVEEVVTSLKTDTIGYVYVQRKFIYKDGKVVQPTEV